MERSETPPLRFQGDWGGANLTRACGWLAQWVWEHTAEHRRSLIRNGRGMGDNLRALAAGEVDVAIATPAGFARLAQDGTGPFEGEAMPQLRAIAVLPHRDGMIPVARAELGFRRLADAAAHPGALRISLGAGDPDGFMGYAGDLLLRLAGLDLETVLARGGSVRRHEQPFGQIADLVEGRADLMISEAIMTPAWQDLAKHDVRFLPLAPGETEALGREGIGTLEVPAGYFPGCPEPLTVMDYSGWIIATTAALPDDVAALLATAVVEGGESFARGYRHLPVEYSPLRYPIDFRDSLDAPIPLHPAAEAVYTAALHTEEAH